MDHSSFIHLPTDGRLGWLQVLETMFKAAINICVQVLCGDKFSTPLNKYQGVWLLDHMVRVGLVCKKLPICLPKWLYNFAFPPAVGRCYTSSPAFGVISVPEFGHSTRCLVVSHCCFNFHFSDDIWCGTSFHMLICPTNIFFGEVFVKIFGPFFNRLFVFLLLNFKSPLYILDNNSSSDESFTNIFSQSVAYLLILLIFSSSADFWFSLLSF